MMGGGRVYWGSNGAEGSESRGVAVMFAWSSINDRDLTDFVDLYRSLGWDALVSHADFLTAFCPEQAMSLAFVLLNELIEVLKIRPSPVIFVAFSGGPKACMYKFFQIIQGSSEAQLHPNECQLVRSCISGVIYDSAPIDFTSDSSAQFALHPTVRFMTGLSKVASWLAKGVATGLDSLYLTRFESQRAEYWQALYTSIELGAPFLILCSIDDDLAPYQVICNFAQRLQDLGGDVKVVKWNHSSHIGHYKHYPIQYRAAVYSLLEKASSVYSHKIQRLGETAGMHDEISELICDLQKAAVNSNQSLRRVATGPSDHFFLPSSAEYQTNRESQSLQEEQKGRSVCLPQPSNISAHSVLGQVLFDTCVPKKVEGWDIRFSGSLNGQPYGSARKRSPVRIMRQKLRSRL